MPTPNTQTAQPRQPYPDPSPEGAMYWDACMAILEAVLGRPVYIPWTESTSRGDPTRGPMLSREYHQLNERWNALYLERVQLEEAGQPDPSRKARAEQLRVVELGLEAIAVAGMVGVPDHQISIPDDPNLHREPRVTALADRARMFRVNITPWICARAVLRAKWFQQLDHLLESLQPPEGCFVEVLPGDDLDKVRPRLARLDVCADPKFHKGPAT